MKIANISKFWSVLLLVLLLVGMVAPLHAANEVTGVTFSETVTSGQYVQVLGDGSGNFTVYWTAPVSSDTIVGYYLKFSTTDAAWTDLDPNKPATYDFKEVTSPTPLTYKSFPKSFFDAYDSNQVRYLLIKTQYLNSSDNLAFSNDVIIPDIKIDNVAPTGTLTLNPTSGSSAIVNVESMSFTEPIKYYWLNSTNAFPGGVGVAYAPPLAGGNGTVADRRHSWK